MNKKIQNRFHWEPSTIIRILVILVIVGTIWHTTNGNKALTFDEPQAGTVTWSEWMDGCSDVAVTACSDQGKDIEAPVSEILTILQTASFTGWTEENGEWAEKSGETAVEVWRGWCADEDLRVQVQGNLDETHTRTLAFDMHSDEGYVLQADAASGKTEIYVLYHVDAETVKALRELIVK